MAVMATDAPTVTNSSNNEATVRSRSPSDGGFTPGWSQEADNRIAERRNRVQAAAESSVPRVPASQPQPISEYDEDDERK